MSYVVAKDFNTVNQRFKVGMPITREELVGDVTFDTWLERGFIKETAAPDMVAVLDEDAMVDTPPAAAPRSRR